MQAETGYMTTTSSQSPSIEYVKQETALLQLMKSNEQLQTITVNLNNVYRDGYNQHIKTNTRM